MPGTIVIDDKWSSSYATCHPDPDKWPDLRSWIGRRHDRGQRVLLWWKAWDVEGAPPDACVRMPDGTPVVIDPETADGRDLIDRAANLMLGADSLDADGLKIDFTASTPSGNSLVSSGQRWGAALLHELLRVAYVAAKSAKRDALVITHTPNPAFGDVTDMVRLNDVMMLDSPEPSVDVVTSMSHRAQVVRAAMPGWPIDTDGWCLPDRDQWRRYLAIQPELGVPAQYYSGAFDRTDQQMATDDYRLLSSTWRGYRSGLT